MGADRSSRRHSAFFDLETNAERDSLTRPPSMLRSTEWGGLTLLSLLAGLAFPPYFLSVMALAFLNAGGMLWVTHLNDAGRKRLKEFEAEFARGHALEESGDYRAAAELYAELAPRYADQPQIGQIAVHRVEYLRRSQPLAFAAAAPKAAAAKAPVKGAPSKSVPVGRPVRVGLRRKPA